MRLSICPDRPISSPSRDRIGALAQVFADLDHRLNIGEVRNVTHDLRTMCFQYVLRELQAFNLHDSEHLVRWRRVRVGRGDTLDSPRADQLVPPTLADQFKA